MFRKMRRKDKTLDQAQVAEILGSGDDGVLATLGEDGYPYALPLNYAYHKGCIYFHSALEGHKIDNIVYHPKVSFCVTQGNEIIADKFNTRFKSVVVFGRAGEVLGDEKVEGLRALVRHLAGDHEAAGETYIQKAMDKTRVFKIEIEHMSGKAAG